MQFILISHTIIHVHVHHWYLNWWICTFDVEAHARRGSIVEEHDTSEQVRGVPQRPARTPNHLHRVVLQSLVLVVIVIAGEE